MNTHTDKAQLYTIREVAKLSGLPESTLRYYETIGLIPPITRDASSKHRVYNEHDVNFAVAIACLNAIGMSIEDMRSYLKNRVWERRQQTNKWNCSKHKRNAWQRKRIILSFDNAMWTSKLLIG